jgi:hypothetical protein
MLRVYFSFLLLCLCSLSAFAQTASSFFPTSTGYKWNYRTYTLDSTNALILNSVQFQTDSLISGATYQGRPASQVLTNIGNPFLRDTTFINFNGNDASVYQSVQFIGGAFENLSRWYNTYRFGQAVNTNYPILDTTFVSPIDTIPGNFNFIVSGRRLSDETVVVPFSSFTNAKRFVVTTQIRYQPLPQFPVFLPLITSRDSIWIGSSTWIVKRLTPSSRIDLSALGLPSVDIPGQLTELVPASFLSVPNKLNAPTQFSLDQNYPNPFNPTTTIPYRLGFSSDVTLEVFDVLGRKVATLVRARQAAGNYNFMFSTITYSLSSGVYFYRFEARSREGSQTGSFMETKKMLLVK